jgi:hypothetical protein
MKIDDITLLLQWMAKKRAAPEQPVRLRYPTRSDDPRLGDKRRSTNGILLEVWYWNSNFTRPTQ